MWSGSREQFLDCGLRKFRHSKSSVDRWYTQLNVVGLFMTHLRQWKRLGRVMVEWTLSITHCLRLNLQLHTIDLVRTCRISSFCTVACSGVLLKMEVGIRKRARQRDWRYPAYLWSLRWVYAVKKTPEVGIRRIPAYTPQYTTDCGILLSCSKCQKNIYGVFLWHSRQLKLINCMAVNGL